ncbi:MAG: phenylacetate--CoA ligase [Clostridia bacterium]|nr:phenylacetate--CoA ligase [Clostridia bacterium]
MIFSREETLSRAELRAIQEERLLKTVGRVYEKVAPYRKKMEEAGLTPADVASLDDLKKLPFITKQDLRDHYPFGFCAVPREQFARVHSSSGTTGKPTPTVFAKSDLDVWSECVARIACAGGATAEDMAQICFGFGMFTGAEGLQRGLERVGAAIVPSSAGNSEKQMLYMKDFGTTLLVATPSYAMRLSEVAREMGLEPTRDLAVRTLLVGSELLTDAMREEMRRAWGRDVKITTNYGMSELMGPGISGECLEGDGLHINEDFFIPEIIDPKTGEVLPEGELGELVITCIKREGMPLVRYRTGDLTRLSYAPCRCGRTTCRMENLQGRSDDMLKVNGVRLFPSQIEEIVLAIPELGPHYEILVEREGYSDRMTVRVELATLTDSFRVLEEIERTVKAKLKTVLGLSVRVKLESPNTLQRFEGKAKRVKDLRKKD